MVYFQLLPLFVSSTEALGRIHANGALDAGERTDTKVHDGEEDKEYNEEGSDETRSEELIPREDAALVRFRKSQDGNVSFDLGFL